MSGAKGNEAAASFEAMIQADRQKRKNQDLANKLLGGGRQGRRSSAPGPIPRRPGTGGSLASRVGINKRVAAPIPRPSINGQWTHDLHKAQAPKRTASASFVERSTKLNSAIQRDLAVNGGNPQFNIRSAPKAQLSIKGKAYPGPYCVIATNFAMGTTEDDIKMAFEPHGEDIKSCKIVGSRPQVTAEAVFTKKESAENVVNVFNNSMADGNLLYVYIKPGPPSPAHNLDAPQKSAQTPPPAPSSSSQPSETAQEPQKVEEAVADVPARDDAMMDVDESARAPREESRRDEGRLGRDNYDRGSSRYQSNGYEDGRYGFSNSYDRRPRQDYRPSYNARPRYDDRSYRGGQRWH